MHNKSKKVEILEKQIEKVYLESPIDFAKWMYPHHVKIVADFALELASKSQDANIDLAFAGALLHDFGDAFLEDRHDAKFEVVTKSEATKILLQCNFSDNEIEYILNKVIKPHSCRDGLMPEIIEAKILATADALAHLTTNFYIDLKNWGKPTKDNDKFKSWAIEKIERDYHVKIFFNDLRNSVTNKYLHLKTLFQ
ncbi:MAG: HD domain-containing protein [Patescibacteria group bacterium]